MACWTPESGLGVPGAPASTRDLHRPQRAPQLVEAADLVTEMREVKHPYTKGILAQRGIDY